MANAVLSSTVVILKDSIFWNYRDLIRITNLFAKYEKLESDFSGFGFDNRLFNLSASCVKSKLYSTMHAFIFHNVQLIISQSKVRRGPVWAGFILLGFLFVS